MKIEQDFFDMWCINIKLTLASWTPARFCPPCDLEQLPAQWTTPEHVVLVYHVTIVVVGYGSVEEMLAYGVIGLVLRASGSYLYF